MNPPTVPTHSAPARPQPPLRCGVWPYFAMVALALAGSLVAPAVGAQTAELAPALQKLATCEDSWYDARDERERMMAIGDLLRAQFQPQDRSPVWKPIGRITWLGAEVLELTPQSVGMALGFAVTLKYPGHAVQPAYEQALGYTLQRCRSGEGMHSCEHKVADKRRVFLMAPLTQHERGTLVGCYYFYQP